jgi:hypothetical protein
MTAWIEKNPYPWHEPVARDLHRRLINAFPEPDEVRNLVRVADAPDWMAIDFGKPIRQVWVQTLDQGTQEGTLGTLLESIVANTRVAADLKSLIKELLADKRPPATSSVGGKDAPAVAPLSPEKLLFEMDLTEPIGDVQGLVDAILRVMAWREAVCLLSVGASDGRTYVGTGTLLVGGCILTNRHVVFPDGTRALSIEASFHYEKGVASKAVAGNVDTIRDGGADDWATFALDGAAPAAALAFDLAHRTIAKKGERAFIIQHPGGREKRLGFVRNQISEVTAREIFYITDTEGGSSGSPVFNGDGKLVGIHCAGGDPQKFVGVPPIVNNMGLRIDVVADAILAP